MCHKSGKSDSLRQNPHFTVSTVMFIIYIIYNMDRSYRYNPNVFYKPNEERYLQLMSAKDLCIQNITVGEYDNHSNSFQVKFPNDFTNYPLCAVRIEIGTIKNCFMANAIEFRDLLCQFCLWCIC